MQAGTGRPSNLLRQRRSQAAHADRHYPGRYQTDVRTPAAAIWEHNLDITPIADGEAGARTIDMYYPV